MNFNEIKNRKVVKILVVERALQCPLSNELQNLGIKHKGIIVVCENGQRYLCHLTPGQVGKNDFVTTSASNCSIKYTITKVISNLENVTVGDIHYYGSGCKDAVYHIIINNCMDGQERVINFTQETQDDLVIETYPQNTMIYQKYEQMPRWEQMQSQQIKCFHEVKHAKSGRIAYEATTQDGNKVLFHNIDNHRPQELTFVEKKNNGYTGQWKQTSQEIDGRALTIKDIQTSGKEINILKLEQMNEKNMIPYTKNSTSYQVGTAIGASAGNLCANLDRMDSKQIAVSATVGGAQIAIAKKVPVLGLGLTGLMTGYSLGSILTQQELDNYEKATETFKLMATTALGIGGAWGGAEIGASIGVSGGPVGVLVGGVLGAFFGGFVTAKVAREVIETQPMTISVSIYARHMNRMGSYGISPYISWNNVRNKVNSFIVIAKYEKYLLWVVKNIRRSTTYLPENCQLGIEIVKGYKYIGPDNECKYVQFEVYGIEEENIYQEQANLIIDLIINKRVTVVQYDCKKIYL